MPGSHAVLAPSAAERWISCPASVRVVAKLPREIDSPYAAEGTAAHALGEIEVRRAFGQLDDDGYRKALQRWRRTYAAFRDRYDEMRGHMLAYVALVQERAAQHPYTQVMVEQRVASGIPGCDGTADVALVSPVHVEIIDLKYGQGVTVEAEGNPQLRLYGVGALEKYGDLLGDVEHVYMTVFQPRLEHTLTAVMAAEDLRAWRDSLLPIAEQALGDDAPFGPSEAACRWCPASGSCPAQLAHVTERDFGTDVDQLSPEEMARALAMAPQIREWLNALEVAALRTAYSEGKPIPGYKVVLSGGKRVIDDVHTADVTTMLTALGYTEEEFTERKLRGIVALEKLLGKQQFPIILADFVRKTEGKPSLVPESDKRRAISPDAEAVKEFSSPAQQ